MALKKCKECGKEANSKAESCPNCGAILKKKTGRRTYLVAAFFLLVLFGVIASLMNETTTVHSSKPEAGLKVPSVGKQIVTFDEYLKIQNGMSYSQVVSIIGAAGEEVTRHKIEGVPGVMEPVETVMYQWVNRSGSNMHNMHAVFQNDKLVQKAQVGLE